MMKTNFAELILAGKMSSFDSLFQQPQALSLIDLNTGSMRDVSAVM
jgi:hypothetical protein